MSEQCDRCGVEWIRRPALGMVELPIDGCYVKHTNQRCAERQRDELRDALRDVQGQLLNYRDGLEGRLIIASVLAGIARTLAPPATRSRKEPR